MKARVWLSVAILAALVVIAGVIGVVGVRIHRSHAAEQRGRVQLAQAQRVFRAVSVPGAVTDTTCPVDPALRCLDTGLDVRGATGRVAASMNALAGVQPRIRCRTSPTGIAATRRMSCIVDLFYGSHDVFVFVVARAGMSAALTGTAVRINVS